MVLIGNSFPQSLIRKTVVTRPIFLSDAKELLKGGFDSFWGHTNTIRAASEILGVDVTPKSKYLQPDGTYRPAVELDDDLNPYFDGKSYTSIILLSPEYERGYRPKIGEEVSADKIVAWQTLLMTFGN